MMIKSKSKVIALLAIMVATIAGAAFTVNSDFVAAEDYGNDSADVHVEVSTKTMVAITPNSFEWEGVEPGEAGGWHHDGADNVSTRAQIENIGSTDVSHIWFSVTQPDERPFATGAEDAYDAGNFLTLNRENEHENPDSEYYFADRKEFNETRELVYLTDPNGGTPPGDEWVYGRFRNTSNEYFWMFDEGDVDTDGDGCPTFYLGDIAHTQTETGTVNFEDGEDQTEISLIMEEGDGTNMCVGDIDNHPLDEHSVFVNADTVEDDVPEVHLSRWNMDLPGADTDSVENVEYFWDETERDQYLLPGNSTVAELNAYVPYGVSDGQVTSGVVTVHVATQEAGEL